MITRNTVLSAHQTVSDEYSHCLNLCIATPSCHPCSARRILLPPWGKGRMERGSEGGREKKKITVAKRGFSTSSPTKSHHFRRLTSVCDKCSTSSSLPISLELETPEASAACKIKNDHLIHSSTKYISGERRKSGLKEREKERECVASALPHSIVQNSPRSIIIKWSTYSNGPVCGKIGRGALIVSRISSFSLILPDLSHCSASSATHSAPHMAAVLKRCWLLKVPSADCCCH